MTPLSRIRTGGILLLLSVVIILTRLNTYHEPLEVDTASYSIIAHELLSGRLLYSDVWDHKPPAIHLTFALAQSIFGYGPGAVYFLWVTATLLTMLGVYAAASAGGRGRAVGLWAAAFFAVISADLYTGANESNTEIFINACMVWVLALLLRTRDRGFGWKDSLIVGLLLALASLYKPNIIISAIALACAHIAFPARGGRREAVYQSLLVAAVGVGGWLLTVGYFYWNGRFGDLWDAVVVYNSFYGGTFLFNLLMGLDPSLILPRFLDSLWPLIVVTFIGIGLSYRHQISRDAAILSFFAFSLIPAISFPGKFYPHYYQFWFPVFSISAAWTLAVVRDLTSTQQSSAMHSVGGVILFLLVFLQIPYYKWNADEVSELKYGNKYLNSMQTAKKIDSFLLPGETFFLWGVEAEIYYYARRTIPSGVFTGYPFLGGALSSKLSLRLKKQISDYFPEIFVVSPWTSQKHSLMRWFHLHYLPFPDDFEFNSFKFYYLKGGAFEKRLLSTGTEIDRASNP